MPSRDPHLTRRGEARSRARSLREWAALSQSAERWAAVTRLRSCAIHVVEFVAHEPGQPSEAVLVGWSEGAEAIYGFTAEEVLGRPVSVIVPPDRLDEFRLRYDRLRQGEPVENLETVRLHKDGRRLEVDLSIAPILREGAGRAAAGAVVVAQDIARRRHAERGLIASERERSRREMAALVHQLHERVKELTALHELARILQDKELSVDQLLQRAAQFLPAAWEHPQVAAARITLDGNDFATSGFRPSTWRQRSACRLADGRELAVEVVYLEERPLVPGGEGPFAVEERTLLDSFAEMLCSHLDALHAAEALARSERRHRALVETARDAIFTISPGGQLTSLSPAFETITGWSCDEWLGKPFTPLVHPEDLPLALDMFDSVLGGQSPRLFRIRIRKSGGGHVVGEFTATPQMADGRLVSVLGVARDITDRLRLEEQLAQAQRMEAVGRFAGGIAHDFNNVLTVIGGCGELLLEHLSPGDPNHAVAAEIQDAVQRAAALTRQLLLFSRGEPLTPTVLDLNEVVRGLQKMLARLLGERVELDLQLAGEPSRTLADRGRIEQAIVNLAVNARDAMPEGGCVTIRTRRVEFSSESPALPAGLLPGPYVLLEVADTGCGMDEPTRTRAFEPFFTTKNPGEGTGLGLSTVFGIVSQCRGHVGIESAPGLGTTVRIHLPATA